MPYTRHICTLYVPYTPEHALTHALTRPYTRPIRTLYAPYARPIHTLRAHYKAVTRMRVVHV